MQWLHMLGVILCLVTLIGALGGSLRFQENFYEEVFDLVDEGSDVKTSKTESSDEMEVTGNDESALTQAEISPDSEPVPPSPVQEVQEEMPEEVEAYDQDEVYASI